MVKMKNMSQAQKLIKKVGKEEASDILLNTENNDCVVRAVQHAFNVEYSQSHHFCETKLNRVPNDGTYTDLYLPKIKQAFGKKITQMGKKGYFGRRKLTRDQKSKVTKYSHAKGKWVTTRKIVQVPYKVKDFLKTFPKGNYIITVKGHAFTVIEGKIIGNWDDSKRLTRRVMSAYKVK